MQTEKSQPSGQRIMPKARYTLFLALLVYPRIRISQSASASDVRVSRRKSETDSIKSQISSKTSHGKKDSTKRRHQRHHHRQPGKQLFPIQVVTGCLTFNIYFYLFLYLHIIRLTINNGTPHLKSPKNKNRRAALGRPAVQ